MYAQLYLRGALALNIDGQQKSSLTLQGADLT